MTITTKLPKLFLNKNCCTEMKKYYRGLTCSAPLMQPSTTLQKEDIHVMSSWIQYKPYWIINSTNYYCLEILTLLRPMEFSMKFDTIMFVKSIVPITGYNFQKYYIFLQTVQTMMKCRLMRHFIWVFTVFHSTRLRVSGHKKGQTMVKDNHFLRLFEL